MGLLVLKKKRKQRKGERKKKERVREKKGKGGQAAQFPNLHTPPRTELNHSLEENRAVLTQARGRVAGSRMPPACCGQDSSDVLGPLPALPVGFVFLGNLLCQLLQDSLLQGQILSEEKAVKGIH